MPELPEIANRAREMNVELTGRRILGAEVEQPKCLNLDVAAFRDRLRGARIEGTTYRGKWLFVKISSGYLLINLGMGGELLLVRGDRLPERWRVRLDLDGDDALAINFWWMGHAHFVLPEKLAEHRWTAQLGPNATEIDREAFARLLAGRRGRVKPLLLNQSRLAGIGNAYIHDILFAAGVHPMRLVASLADDEIDRLHEAVRSELARSLEAGGACYEVDLHGAPGGFRRDDLIIAYREGEPCPRCGSCIEKIRTGSTSSYICPRCQALPGRD